MKCLRCGYCCKNLLVTIVDDPKKGLVSGNFITHGLKPGKPCKHLRGSGPGDYSCALHDKPWYKDTPCFQHTQIEHKDSDCRIGSYILKHRKLAE